MLQTNLPGSFYNKLFSIKSNLSFSYKVKIMVGFTGLFITSLLQLLQKYSAERSFNKMPVKINKCAQLITKN